MGIETALIASAVIGAGSSIIGGIQQRNEAKKQAGIIEREAEQSAAIERQEANTAARIQKTQFLKSGVTLSGSPLLLMQETYARGEQNARNVLESGQAKAKSVRKSGQNAFYSGIMGGFQSAGSALLSGYDLGAFTPAAKNPNATANTNATGSRPAAGTNQSVYQTA